MIMVSLHTFNRYAIPILIRLIFVYMWYIIIHVLTASLAELRSYPKIS
jgi:hypothetical protein